MTSDKREHNSKKMRENNHGEPQEFDIDDLFRCIIKKNWKQVLNVYKNNPLACKAKLTKSEETALHIAVSSYHADRADAEEHAEIVCQLVDSIPQDNAVEILQAKNDKGDTPLHLAAALGSVRICRCIAEKDGKRISSRNLKGETPLFLAAHHGKKEAFLQLHMLYIEYAREPDDSLCRRKDGDTVLHSAISGEYFELAYQIISYYPGLVNSVNQEGFSPLHILARKPNVFESSSNLQLCDRMIYRYATVDELKKTKFSAKSYNISSSSNVRVTYPGNYQTCVNFIYLLGAAFRVIFSLGKVCGSRKQLGSSTDVENTNRKVKEDQAYVKESGKELNEDRFPPNYATCIKVFNSAMNFVLAILEIAISRISKIREKKKRHSQAVQIMNQLINLESDYKYKHNGRSPTENIELLFAGRIDPPLKPPAVLDTPSSLEDNIYGRKSHDKEEKYWSEPDAKTKNTKETPILLAARMGIVEMVTQILEIFPEAIQDLDPNEKNALLLAVENRQTKVYELLRMMDLPEFVLYQVDDKGNSAMHLAAQFREHQHWRVPGAVLQMQWEIKWYKHVKDSIPPQCFNQYNKKGETAKEIFTRTHKNLIGNASEWLMITSESCSMVAALIVGVAFASSSTVPGSFDQTHGYPLLEREPAFKVFSIPSVVAFFSSLTALVFFIAILSSRCQQQDFKHDLPRRLMFGLSSLFTSIAAILVSFCAGNFFILKDQLHSAAFPIYAVASLPLTLFAFSQLPLYFDLLQSTIRKGPFGSYKVFYH